MDATCCKVHPRMCSGTCHTGGSGRLIDRTKGGRNTKLHAVCDGKMRILRIHATKGSASDYVGAKVPLEQLPKEIKWLVADGAGVANQADGSRGGDRKKKRVTR